MDAYERYLRIASGEEHLIRESCLEFERFSKQEESISVLGIIRILMILALIGVCCG